MFFFSSRRRHTRLQGDWSSDVCSSDLFRLQIASALFEIGACEGALDVLSKLEIPDRNSRSEERRVGKGVDLGGRRIIKKKKKCYLKILFVSRHTILYLTVMTRLLKCIL